MASQNERIQCTPEDPGVGPGVVIASGQTYDPPLRYLIVSTAGTIDGQMVGDTAAHTAYVFPVGNHKVALKSCGTATTIVAFGLR